MSALSQTNRKQKLTQFLKIIHRLFYEQLQVGTIFFMCQRAQGNMHLLIEERLRRTPLGLPDKSNFHRHRDVNM